MIRVSPCARTGRSLLGALALLVVLASPVGAAPGDLDPTFDADGKVTRDFGGNFDGATGVVVQDDGKVVVVGSSLSWERPESADFALARYNSDGSLDSTFDGDGTVLTDFAGLGDEAQAVAIQSDGKIVVAGVSGIPGNTDFALARYNSDGSLDATFDGLGMVTTDFAGDDEGIRALAIQEDGNIVVAGYVVFPPRIPADHRAWDFAMARYTPDGLLDSSFDGDGKLATDFAGGNDLAHGLALQSDGKIVVSGQASVPLGPSVRSIDFGLARYGPDGSLDRTFDGDGRVTTNFATDFDDNTGDFAKAVAIQWDGRIIVAGHTLIDLPVGQAVISVFNLALARYNADGSLDPSFGGDGSVTTDLVSSARALAIQGDGKIVAAGDAGGDFALVRYNVDGVLDKTFGGGDGVVTTDFDKSGDGAWAVGIQEDGKILAAGQAGVEAAGDFGLARYTVCRRTSMRTPIACR